MFVMGVFLIILRVYDGCCILVALRTAAVVIDKYDMKESQR